MPKPKDGKQKKITGSGAEGGATGPNSTSNPVILQSDNSIAIRILAKPGAKQNGITGLTSEGVGVQISAPPVEGEANTELVKYISKVLGVRKSDLQLDKGSKSRNKILLLDKSSGLTVQAVIDKLTGEVS